MIEFLQNYETKALPPERFTAEQRVERSEESEQYFVKLGVAGFVGDDGKLLDADYRPIVPTVAIIAVDPRAIRSGRAGEVLTGIDAPARASTGPGNAVLFGGDQQTAAARNDFDQMTNELATAQARVVELEAGQVDSAEHERLKGDLATAQARIAELEGAPDYERDKLSDKSLKSASKNELLVIAAYEKADVSQGDKATMADLIAAIEKKRTA